MLCELSTRGLKSIMLILFLQRKHLRQKHLEILVIFIFCLSVALMVVHAYHPLSKTLAEVYLARSSAAYGNTISETYLVGFIVQIAGAISRIHSASLAARIIDPTKVIVTGKNR